MSIARANKNKANVCLDFFYKKRIDTNPPNNPAIRGIYLWKFSDKYLLAIQRTDLNRRTKLPTNNPKLIESFPVNILMKFIGFENIFLIPKTELIPLLTR